VTLSETKLRAALLERVKKAGMAKIAAFRLGISAQYLSDVINGRRDISEQLAEKLGYRKVVMFVPIESEVES
jgi:hypothetical protein